MRPQRVLVTGGSGFIGSHVVQLLQASGRDVAVLRRVGRSGNASPLASADVEAVPYVEGESASLRESIAAWGPTACIHLAWYAEPGKYLHSSENISALAASVEVLTALIEVGCTRVAMAGTCAEYDASVGWLKEGGPTRPDTLYAASKLSACLITQQLAAQAHVQLAWGRIFFPYGPGEDQRRAIPSAIRALLAGQRFPATKGEQIRDYIHVEDVAAAFITLIDSDASGVFNVSSGIPVSMRQVMDQIGEIIGSSDQIDFGAVPYRNWDPMFICGDNTRLRGLGWQPTHSLRAGLEDTVTWWRAHR